MSFLIDSDVASGYLRGHSKIGSRLIQYGGRLHLSVVTVAELKAWLYRPRTPVRFREAFEDFTPQCVILPVDEEVAETYGRLAAQLLERGLAAPTPDLLIAATALVHDLTLATGNERHFAPIAGLRVENWLQS